MEIRTNQNNDNNIIRKTTPNSSELDDIQHSMAAAFMAAWRTTSLAYTLHYMCCCCSFGSNTSGVRASCHQNAVRHNTLQSTILYDDKHRNKNAHAQLGTPLKTLFVPVGPLCRLTNTHTLSLSLSVPIAIKPIFQSLYRVT